MGYGIHLKLGSESLSAWGAYLAGAATLILACAAIWAGLVGFQDYRYKVIAEKSKWLLQLYEKSFENAQYKEVRRKLDYDDTEEIKTLIRADAVGLKFTLDQQKQFDAFTDYLNFVELIARLKIIGQLSGEAIKATFDYYLNLLKKQRNPEIRGYLLKEGFENLNELLLDYEKQSTI
ncbi:MAG TPA: hypothetical protein VLA42_13925 [Verrucomicrobiae bacterium]|nr:hypothetical protein [Verrucomicrobiae bacterium]